jgi:N-acetyl-gamma-glutamyl-phosphate reductase
MTKKINAAIIGVLGYAGEELLKILSKHKYVSIVYIADKSDSGGTGKKIKDIYPRIDGNIKSMTCVNFNIEELKRTPCEVVFLALPHGVPVNIVPEIMKIKNKKVIDLSADYRINNIAVYEKWYGIKHNYKDLLSEAVYGLPELYKTGIKSARLIANPGCYPTSIILACAPILKQNLIDVNSIIIDAKSGISGGGRKFAGEYNAKNSSDTYAYKTGGTHRHIPEIEQELNKLCGRNIHITFTPHIVPQERGMSTAIYLSLITQGLKLSDIVKLYNEFYKDEPFVRILPEGELPHTDSVVNTNYCDIGFSIDKRTNKLILFSAIDNLVKGASGQAVQNMNITCRFDEKEGLIQWQK